MKKRILSGIIVCILILTTPALAFADEEMETQAAGIANNGLAGIYIDINAAPYTDFANISNWGKYAYGPSGCAWFASARVKQLTGKGNMIYSGSSWWNQQYANFGFGRGSTISAPAIACYSGHVAIVEKIEGNYAYISEGGNTSYPGNSYCVIRKRSISDITSGALGFVYLGNAVPQPQPAAPSFTDQAVTYVDDWNAIVYTRVLNPGRRVVAQAGCRIYNASGSLLKSYTENCNLSTSYVNYNCNFVSDMNYPLDPGTLYKYQQFVIIDGKEYADQMRSFSTTGSRDNLAPKISNVKLDVYDTYYTIKCDVYEETEFIRKSIEFPTWTEHNGQDDLIYHGDGGFTYLPGTDTNHYRTYFYDIPISEHNNEKGNYITRISARDAAGNTSSLDVVVSLGEYKYKVTDNSAVTQDTYQHPSSLTVPATLGSFPVKEANLSDLEGIESITYSNGITKVGDIRNAESLVQIKLPDTIEELGSINVPNLETIDLPDTLIEMGWLQAPKMKSIDFPASLLKLDGISAENMENITLPENLKVLGYYGFNGCKKLKNVKLPASLEAIYTNRSGGVLEQCDSLQKIELDEKNPNFLLINGILMNKDGTIAHLLADRTLKLVVVPDTVTELDAHCFADSKVQTVKLSENLKTIGIEAFLNCTELEVIDFPEGLESFADSNTYGGNNFKNCVNLKEVRIPKSFQSFAIASFVNCKSLKKIVIDAGAKVKNLEECMYSSSIETLVLPSSTNLGFLLMYMRRLCSNDDFYINIFINQDAPFAGELIQAQADYPDHIKVTFDDTVDLEETSLSETSLTMEKGETHKPTLQTTPQNIECANVEWTTSNSKIADVDQEGNIRALRSGIAKITATVHGAGRDFTAEATVSVSGSSEYKDVRNGDWYYEPVQKVSKSGIMTGLNEFTFGAAENLSRGQFATILYRLEFSPQVDYQATFPDVPNDQFYTSSVLWANQKKVVGGYQNGYFGPADKITREQMAVMMYRYATYKRYDVFKPGDLGSFTDSESVSSFAKEAMIWSVGAGIISGKDNGTKLDPQGDASRAECATIIMRFMEKYME